MATSRAQKRAEDLFRAKAARRQELSRLPIEKKISILISLQKMASEVRKTVGGITHRPWDIRLPENAPSP